MAPRPLTGRWNGGLAVCVAAWAAAVASGFAVLGRYKSAAADQERPAAGWPAQSSVPLSAVRPTLLLFAHPRCPCTHASVSELARLLARLPDRVSTHVLMVQPAGVPDGWADTALWQRAAALPGATVWRDRDGREAARFGAGASGLILLYDPAGRRLFSGGITASRGHEGDSVGRRRLQALLAGHPVDRDESPVFGCALGRPSAADRDQTVEARP
jgi:hypothetical protein